MTWSCLPACLQGMSHDCVTTEGSQEEELADEHTSPREGVHRYNNRGLGSKQQKAKQEMGQNANEERYGRATGVKVTLKNMLTTKRAPVYLMIFT